jgi:hypothetical protein
MVRITRKRTHRRGESAASITRKTSPMEYDDLNTATPSVDVSRLALVLTWIARQMPANRLPERPDRAEYPQLWYCWPRWSKRIKWIHRLKTWLCGKLTGHEWSRTEWGYRGGKHVDRWCRWCNHCASVPIAESPPPNQILADLTDKLGK